MIVVTYFSLKTEDPVKKPKSVADVRYGIGGSSRYLSRYFAPDGYGVTMSPTQVEKAKVLAAAQELDKKVIRINHR
ncbi:Methyltransferase type 11 [Artemisia annua]|uniref:Methyltransferase type 11 n=1 Tax=Artemisia annua TaxID=35608 RepID=A0A2U1QNW8_ARTAN|nr:Methyltransferase type 11 [Artemisia annua]